MIRVSFNGDGSFASSTTLFDPAPGDRTSAWRSPGLLYADLTGRRRRLRLLVHGTWPTWAPGGRSSPATSTTSRFLRQRRTAGRRREDIPVGAQLVPDRHQRRQLHHGVPATSIYAPRPTGALRFHPLPPYRACRALNLNVQGVYAPRPSGLETPPDACQIVTGRRLWEAGAYPGNRLTTRRVAVLVTPRPSRRLAWSLRTHVYDSRVGRAPAPLGA